ncbi:MAG: hypothetical protein HN742_37500 [Lentisphaerae bacterium]|jgi:hypothetical protein|nr:hypothetical protein [Lentisphaerota bacterium]MBT4823555.1 hypothetical protein [Lentisphaerota bacterium]MBT5613224.1 hypothetical protein [Lentisphaerota bacterium]MBT7062113.1 hypothetical protein [Lentisphaerota bacterium]MBT7847625.1 hypothetical protein [Lentisphaerota bacterium]
MIGIATPGSGSPVLDAAARILARELHERFGTDTQPVSSAEGNGPTIVLSTIADLPEEGFRIRPASGGGVHIEGGDARGVLYGCGRFLRGCRLGPRGIQFPASEISSSPGKPIRGIYFAVHMHNTYHVAPTEDVTRYIEELALWGINTIAVYYHMFHYKGIDDPAACAFIDRLNAIFEAARAVGMKTLVLVTANDAYLNSPEPLRYVGDVPRNWGTELCPSKPAARELLLKQFREAFERFPDVDYLNIWPYDSGGCLCDTCAPWGVKGLYPIAEEIARAFRETHPQGKVVLSTWYFDYNCGEWGEWETFFDKNGSGELEWVDLVMADGAYVNGYFPRQLLEHPISKPVIGFLEISMRTGTPWGSFGANPMPGHIASEWARMKDTIQGGTPYSEGIFEDVNKVLWAQLCWDPDRGVDAILEEYAAYEFSPDCAGEVARALRGMEEVGRREPIAEGTNEIVLKDTTQIDGVWAAIDAVDRALPLERRTSWRWRLVFLRASIDVELKRSNGTPTPGLGRAYDELFRLYGLDEDAMWFVRPYEVVWQQDTNGERELHFLQRGKQIGEICHFRAAQHEEAAVLPTGRTGPVG